MQLALGRDGIGGQSFRGSEPSVALPRFPSTELPPMHGFFTRVWKRPPLMHYNRLMVGVFLANILYFIFGLDSIGDYRKLSDLVLVNLSVALLVRQHYVVNLLFRIVTSAPVSWPLGLRWTLGKIYHLGGFHVGGAIAGTIWYGLEVMCLSDKYFSGGQDLLRAYPSRRVVPCRSISHLKRAKCMNVVSMAREFCEEARHEIGRA